MVMGGWTLLVLSGICCGIGIGGQMVDKGTQPWINKSGLFIPTVTIVYIRQGDNDSINIVDICT